MTYTQWFNAHADKHHLLIQKLLTQRMDSQQIVTYFEFENMVKHERDFCLLYATKTKCHDIPNLNCYWCACPYFRFDDNASANPDGITVFSHCSIHAPRGGPFYHENIIHHDCSACTIPHDPKTIQKSFSPSWRETMSECTTALNI